MTDYKDLAEEIYILSQSNQSKLGRFFETQINKKLILNAEDTKNLNKLTQQYTDVMYLSRDLLEEESSIGILNKAAIVKNKLLDIDNTIASLISTSIPELKFAINSIRQKDLKNKVGELTQVSSSTLNQEKEDTNLNSNIQSNNNSNTTNNSNQKIESTDISNVKAADWGIKFTVIELTGNSANQLLQADSLATGVFKKPKNGPYRFGPIAPTGKNFYMTLLPAMASQLNLQGARDVPNAMPGLSFKIIPNIAKLKVPGFQPIYQNLGIDTVLCTLVGCFTGADGISQITDGSELSINKTQNYKGELLPYKGNGVFFKNGSDESSLKAAIAQLDSYRNFQEFYEMTVLSGKEVKVEINLAKTSGAAIKLGKDKNLRAGNGNPKFQAVIKGMEIYHSKSDRTWYTLQLEVTNFGLASKDPINLTNKLNDRIKAAQLQNQKENKQTAQDIQKQKEAEEYLKKVQGTQYKLKDGALLYQVEDCSERRSSIDKANFPCKEKWILQNPQGVREITDPAELDNLKSQRTDTPTTGDFLGFLGSSIGCATGVTSTAAAGVGALATTIGTGGIAAPSLLGVGALGVLTGVSCYSAITDLANIIQGKGEGKTVTEGAIDLGVGVVPGLPKLGKAGMSAIKQIPGVSNAASKVGSTIQASPLTGNTIKFFSNTSGKIVDSTSEIFPKINPFLQKTVDRLNPKNYSIFNRSSNVSSTTAQVLNNTDEASTFIGPLGQVNNTFKSIGDFLTQAKATASSGSRIILQDGKTFTDAKIANVLGNNIIVTTANKVEYVDLNTIKSIQLSTGEIWRLP